MATQSTNVVIPALRRAFSQPAFVAVAIILLLAAAGLNAATRFLQLHFRKLPVPPARELTLVPDRLGHWLQVSQDETVSHEFQEALATDKYVFRDYVDDRLVTAAELAEFKDKTPGQRKQLVYALQLRKPEAVVNVGLTYYTGLVDTVAHIPERCYIADGYEPTKYDVESWEALRGRPGDEKLRFIVFEDPTPGRTLKRNVAYFFNCNGQYTNDSIGVRRRLANLMEKYGYYMKIEVQTMNLGPDEAKRVMNDFLGGVLPEAEKCLPDWAALTAAR